MSKRGKLMLIGGAEDREGECRVLRRFVELIRKKNPHVAVMTVATGNPAEVGQVYQKAFRRIGVSHVELVGATCREDAQSQRVLRPLQKADAVFFTGGDQFKITTILGGTEADRLLEERYRSGMTLGGTSAGANMMPSAMIIGGQPPGNPRIGCVELGPGMEFLRGTITDSHFSQRGRLGRLLAAVAQYPHDIGIGIDEDTAAIVDGDRLECFGTNAITIVDMTDTTHTNTSRVAHGESLTLFGIKLHILSEGSAFNLKRRLPIPVGRGELADDELTPKGKK
jgi:cyanophycinase